jgi:hypothetical protein
MSLTLLLYLTEVINNINKVLGFALVLYFISLVIFTIINTMSRIIGDDEVNNFTMPLIKKWLSKAWMMIILLFISLFIPTQKTMYMMLGSSYLSNSNIPNQVSEILNLKLNDVLKELKKEVKE